jgi:DNA-binding CsgD family transcriptional regulator
MTVSCSSLFVMAHPAIYLKIPHPCEYWKQWSRCTSAEPHDTCDSKKSIALVTTPKWACTGGKESFKLTPREKEVLTLMVASMSYKMIADKCKISFETVRSHIKNIYEKLHVATMTEAVAKAIRSRLV